MGQKMQPKAQNCNITHFLDSVKFSRDLPKIEFFYTNIVCTFVSFYISAT